MSDELKEKRLSKCRACPEYGQWWIFRFVKWLFPRFQIDRTAKCNICNCFVEAKTGLTISRCPMVPAKW